jgi:hypothetical protein
MAGQVTGVKTPACKQQFLPSGDRRSSRMSDIELPWGGNSRSNRALDARNESAAKSKSWAEMLSKQTTSTVADWGRDHPTGLQCVWLRKHRLTRHFRVSNHRKFPLTAVVLSIDLSRSGAPTPVLPGGPT